MGYPSELELAQVAVAALSIVPRRFAVAAEAQPVETAPDDPLRGSKPPLTLIDAEQTVQILGFEGTHIEHVQSVPRPLR